MLKIHKQQTRVFESIEKKAERTFTTRCAEFTLKIASVHKGRVEYVPENFPLHYE